MLATGATGFRLNTSHLELDQLQSWLNRLEPFLSRQEPRPPLVLDLQGSKWRLGDFAPLNLVPGQEIKLVLAASSDSGALPVPHEDFFQAAEISSPEILLNDARSELRRLSSGPDWMTASVVRGGEILPHKGITYLSSDYRKESPGEKDDVIIQQTKSLYGLRYAISYIKDVHEMERYRASLGSSAYLIAKLERQPAIDQADAIARLANELWLCRGDMGAELGLRRMAEAVHRFSKKVRGVQVPVMMAGQVLEHMTRQPSPTRSEVCYLFDCLAAGYAGFVLSDEAAVGDYPVESCRAAALFKQNGEPDED